MDLIFVVVLRLLATAAAGYGLWRLWRQLAEDRLVSLIVAVGLVGRIVAAQVLFWVSYLELPYGASLQHGNGFWFFAHDASLYYDLATGTAGNGLAAIWHLDPTLPSVFYVKALGLAHYLFGPAPSAGLILNGFSYLGACVLIARWGRRARVSRLAQIAPIAVVSFFPSWFLWSLQPLKDTFFLSLVTAFFLATMAFLDSVRARPWRPGAAGAALATIGLIAYGVAGIRWYFAFVMAGASVLACFLLVVADRQYRLTNLSAGLALFVVMAIALPAGSGPDMPSWARTMLRPAILGGTGFLDIPRGATSQLERGRGNFTRAEASTQLLLGPSAPVRAGRPDRDATAAVLPESFEEKMFVGMIGMFVPSALATSLGWVSIGGGRGLLVFADLDTLLFNVTLLLMIIVAWHQYRHGFAIHPVAWPLLITALTIGVLLCYTAPNLGTLLRLRSMVAIGFVLLPLALVAAHRANAPSRDESRDALNRVGSSVDHRSFNEEIADMRERAGLRDVTFAGAMLRWRVLARRSTPNTTTEAAA